MSSSFSFLFRTSRTHKVAMSRSGIVRTRTPDLFCLNLAEMQVTRILYTGGSCWQAGDKNSRLMTRAFEGLPDGAAWARGALCSYLRGNLQLGFLLLGDILEFMSPSDSSLCFLPSLLGWSMFFCLFVFN